MWLKSTHTHNYITIRHNHDRSEDINDNESFSIFDYGRQISLTNIQNKNILEDNDKTKDRVQFIRSIRSSMKEWSWSFKERERERGKRKKKKNDCHLAWWSIQWGQLVVTIWWRNECFGICKFVCVYVCTYIYKYICVYMQPSCNSSVMSAASWFML